MKVRYYYRFRDCLMIAFGSILFGHGLRRAGASLGGVIDGDTVDSALTAMLVAAALVILGFIPSRADGEVNQKGKGEK